MKTLRVQLVPTDRTDLVCLSCGGFTVKIGRARHFAVVPPGGTSDSAAVGVHAGCVAGVRARRQPQAPSPEPPIPA